MTTLNLIAIRDGESNGGFSNGGFNSPAKEKAAIRGPFQNRFHIFRRVRHIAKLKLLLVLCAFCGLFWFFSRIPSSLGWNLHSSPSRGGYTVLVNTWKRNSLLKQSVAHYASCHGTDAIHVIWSESDPPSASLKDYLNDVVIAKSQTAHKPTFKFNVNEEDNLNNRFKPIKDLKTDAIFSIDDDVIVPCGVLDFAFTVWQTAPSAMVGFVPRMHWLGEKVWRMVVCLVDRRLQYSFDKSSHRKYLDLYTNQMPASIRDYVMRERNCEDIAMSLLVANATAAPPIWVKGKIHEIGSHGISSLKDHSSKRHKCLNDFVSLYGALPLVSIDVKAVDARKEWFW